jgi:hypothetical protein
MSWLGHSARLHPEDLVVNSEGRLIRAYNSLLLLDLRRRDPLVEIIALDIICSAVCIPSYSCCSRYQQRIRKITHEL